MARIETVDNCAATKAVLSPPSLSALLHFRPSHDAEIGCEDDPCGFEERLEPETDLYRAVIDRAFRDAIGLAPDTLRNDFPVERDRARRWLLEDRLDFPAVCDLAGVSATYLRRAARRLAASGWTGGHNA